jgi:fused signal recognition particle receptor
MTSPLMTTVPAFALAPTDPTFGAVALLLVLTLVVYALRRRSARRRREREEADLDRLAKKRAPTAADRALERAATAVEKAQADRASADERARREQEERRQREESARARAEEEAAAKEESERLAQELESRLAAAATDDERRAIREEAARARVEAGQHRKEASQAERRADYEAKKAREADDKARRRAEDEQRKLEALEAARQEAEAAARVEAERLRRIEAEGGRTLAEGLEKTRGGFMARLASLVGASTTLDDRFLGELEEILFTADIGVRTADKLMAAVRDRLKRKELANPDKVKSALREEIERILTLDGRFIEGGLPPASATPQVVMIVGVNGSGKTTTLGKLAFQQRVAGRNVILGAGDTFRAAAAEQLDVWAGRAEVDLVRGPADSDPAAVCFDAVQRAVAEKRDLCLLDTAGRLHTKVGLMDELKKVRRVVDKALPGAPHETWLVVDGTTGQNGLEQAKQFHETLGLTGIVLTKLDGTAKGGVVIGISDQVGVPVRYVGVGEKIGDLKPFSPKAFVEALFA